jgi:serine/threonine-protein kinase
VKVLDFGVARLPLEATATEAAPDRALTRVGMVIGTPGYMSPEQAVGEHVDYRTDLYALGVLLWEMIEGRPLFTGEDLTAILTCQLTQRVPKLKGQGGDLPATFDEVVSSLLAHSAKDRPASTSAVHDRLRKLLGGQPSVPLSATSRKSRRSRSSNW